MYLLDIVRKMLKDTENTASYYPQLQDLASQVKELQQRLNDPLRVAVVGLVSAGKSTLINAILRKQILVTGRLETTHNISWFKYGDTPSIILRFKNGESEKIDIDELANWTIHESKDSNMKINDVKYVEIYDNNPMLKNIEIIDTPGLESVYSDDSGNTIDFLGMSSILTTQEASRADAIIYAFSKGMGNSDSNILSVFQNSFTNATPINAFGVLTRIDAYWMDDTDPFDIANKIIERYKDDPYVKSKLYTVLSVSSKTSGCCSEITDNSYEIIKKLSEIPIDRLRKLFRNAKKFCSREYDDIPVSASDRNSLYEQFDLYGTYIAVKCVKDGIDKTELPQVLYKQSGMENIIHIIHNHFGKHSKVIKINYIISRIKEKCHQLLADFTDENSKTVVKYILDEFQQLEENEQSFSIMKILQFYYNGDLKLEEKEENEFLRLTGEIGTTIEDKLNCHDLSIKEMTELAQKKANYWYERANLRYGPRTYIEMAQTLARSCEITLYHLKNIDV